MSSERVWVIKGSEKSKQKMSNLKLRIDSKLFTFQEEAENIVTVQEMYRTFGNSAIVFQIVGTWSPLFGLIFTKLTVWQRRSDLGGIQMKCTTIEVK